MGLSSTISKSVVQAFNAIGDLSKTVRLIRKQTGGFDFSTGVPVPSTASDIFKKVIIKDVKRGPKAVEGNNVKVAEISFISDNVAINAYDSVEIDGVVWRITSDMSKNQFITKLRITRGV